MYAYCLSGRIYYNRSVKTKFEAILFDLDGTLLDTLVDLAGSMNAALAKMGFAHSGRIEGKRGKASRGEAWGCT